MDKHVTDIRARRSWEGGSETGGEGIQVLSLVSLKSGAFKCIPAMILEKRHIPVSALSNMSRG